MSIIFNRLFDAQSVGTHCDEQSYDIAGCNCKTPARGDINTGAIVLEMPAIFYILINFDVNTFMILCIQIFEL